MADAAPQELGDGDAKVLWPQDGGLAKRWEDHPKIRGDLRSRKEMLRWPIKKGKETKGVPSMAALTLNLDVVKCALEEWVKFQLTPKSPPVDWLKHEAWPKSADLLIPRI